MAGEPTHEQIEQYVKAIEESPGEYSAYLIGSMENGWYQYARCLGMGEENFLEGGRERIQAAKAVCAECVVTEPCLTYALRFRSSTDPEDAKAVWGGKTGRQRRTILSQRAEETG